ncbi:MAG: fibronectin type III domain-containing protein, partial [Candidatus Thermoplasmatota archaeon]|nr:fibronectin type III domain-containing protein [Candidatus Thermoplasmatota archaeon]
MVPDSPVLNAMSGDSYVDLHWSPPGSDGGSPIVSYLILRGTQKDSMEAHATVSGLNFTDTEVQKGMTYHYTVRAGNRIGYGIPSEIVSARPISVPAPPELSVADFGDRM